MPSVRKSHYRLLCYRELSHRCVEVSPTFAFAYCWSPECWAIHIPSVRKAIRTFRAFKLLVFFLVENKLPIVTSLWPFTSIVIVFGVRCLNTKPKFLAADTRAASSGLCAWYSNLHERTEYHFCFIRTSNDRMKCFQLTVHLCSPASRCGTVRVNGKNYEHAPRRPWQRPPNSCRTTWTQARIED